MKVAYYISDYGYGHATRSIAIMRELLKKNQKINIIICHSFAENFIKDSIRDERITFRKVKTDIGYILNAHTLELDHEKMNQLYDYYLDQRESCISYEVQFLTENQISHVITDIYPNAIEAANKLSIPSIGVSNFFWSDVYETVIPSSKLKIMKQAYSKLTYFLQLEGAVKLQSKEAIVYNFFSRKIEPKEVARIRKKLNLLPTEYLIFYGLGMKMNHNHVDKLKLWSSENCKFIVSSHISIDHPNVHCIPDHYLETQNYVAASDFTITKPGWSTVAEAINGKSRLLLLERDSFIEDKATIQSLERLGLCKSFSPDDFLSMEFDKQRLDNLNSIRVQSKTDGNNSLVDLISQLNIILNEVKV